LGGGSWQALLYIYLTLSLTAFTGVTMGLLISALTSNSDRATGFVPVALIPQIIFSGAIVSLDKMGAIGGFVSQFVVARWGYQAVGTLANLESIPSPRLRFNGPPPEFATQIEKLFNGGINYQAPDWYLIPGRDPEFEINLALHWLIPGLIISLSLILIFIFQWRKDQNYK